MARTYFVYIMASETRVLYTGVTTRLHACVEEHRSGGCAGFTRRHRVSKLVYFESHVSRRAATRRMRQIRAWSRPRRVEMVTAWNPVWADLAESWFEERTAMVRAD